MGFGLFPSESQQRIFDAGVFGGAQGVSLGGRRRTRRGSLPDCADRGAMCGQHAYRRADTVGGVETDRTAELGARGGSGLCAADRAFAVGSDDVFGFNGADFPGCDSLRLSQSARKREKDGVQHGDWRPDGDCLPD